MPASAGSKVCVMCGEDVTSKARTKDSKGRYLCKACYERAAARQQALTHPKASAPVAVSARQAQKATDSSQVSQMPGSKRKEIFGEGVYGLEAAPPPRSARAAAPDTPAANYEPPPDPSAPPVICPSCERPMPPSTVVCVDCGISLETGRSILTAEQGDTERMYDHARGILWFASLILWLGLFPISSEAHGSYKPWALRFIALFTVLCTVSVWWFESTGSPQMQSLKNLYQWGGQAPPDAERIEGFYEVTSFGDWKAFERRKAELRSSVPPMELARAALESLPPAKRCFGEFHIWQLLTCAFLHANFLHLLGNMVFLLVFGSRINALIGNVGTLVLYPVLAIASSLPELVSMVNEQPTYSLGASGAIMGLAGMYFVLFPVSPVHVAAFIRVPILLLGFFKCRGFWILLFYFGTDVLFTVLGSEDGTAHWAHMGGFLAGIAIALALLVTKGVNARGCDLISALLGHRAWSILGKPSQWLRIPEGEGWLTRMRILPHDWSQQLKASIGSNQIQ